jgi:hypothetical protein
VSWDCVRADRSLMRIAVAIVAKPFTPMERRPYFAQLVARPHVYATRQLANMGHADPTRRPGTAPLIEVHRPRAMQAIDMVWSSPLVTQSDRSLVSAQLTAAAG